MQVDRSLRSVFVGNIPYDATEEKLRDIFSAVGPVLSFRIVFDRETGKPKGYGFCEYKDQETATSAIRNLNGHDLGGRQLRVDSASNERARDEPDAAAVPSSAVANEQNQINQHQHQPQPVQEPLVDAQTLINNVMCSFQPEQLFDLCKQLKTSLLINPNETRQLLMQNPQLSFAVLQSLVMIKAIDPNTAMNTLHQQLMQPPLLQQTIPMVMQAQVMNPFNFIPPNPMVAPMGPPVSMAVVPPSTSADPRLASADPRLASVDPRLAPVDHRLASADPRLASADPRLARQQQQHQQQPPPQPQQQQQQFANFPSII